MEEINGHTKHKTNKIKWKAYKVGLQNGMILLPTSGSVV